MIMFQNSRMVLLLFTVCIFALVSTGYAQNERAEAQDLSSVGIIEVPAGQEMKVEGVLITRQSDSLLLNSLGGGTYKVILAGNTKIKEKKKNPFRGAKNYSSANLIPGLQMEVKGAGDGSGAIAAREIRFRNDDLIVAQAMDKRVIPVENQLEDTQVRLAETEENARTLSGQVQELAIVSSEARGNAKKAQQSADKAMNAAKNAQSIAESGVKAANKRITALDDYQVKNTVTVYFKAGSSVLSEESQSTLREFAEENTNEKAYLVEVAGFASADGNEAFNRRLSQRRADAVIQFLAEHYSIPLRRFLTPMGYGESRPVADNSTRAGREENRRVEVRMLVNRGLILDETSSPAGSDSIESPTDQWQ
jgi:outer membrane protein OmpA-like peptidoglycan-associated protein